MRYDEHGWLALKRVCSLRFRCLGAFGAELCFYTLTRPRSLVRKAV
jgi:hypothetical protein